MRSSEDYKNSFIFYESFYTMAERIAEAISIEEAYHYLSKTMEYGLYGDNPSKEDKVWLYGFDTVKATINSAKARYKKKIEIPEEELREFLEEGKSIQDIAEHYSCSTDTITRRKKEYGLMN